MDLTEEMLATEELEDFSVKKVYPNAAVTWTDEQNRPHREDGPAHIHGEYESWHKHGVPHRIGGPAWSSAGLGSEGWMVDGKYHRDDGPAYTSCTGTIPVKAWYLNGKKVTEADVRALGKMK